VTRYVNLWAHEWFRRLARPAMRRRLTAALARNAVAWYYRNAAERDLAPIYGGDYQAGYTRNPEPERRLKKYQALAVARALPAARKILVAGCSNGLLVAEFRRLGKEAFGFDISEDIFTYAEPEVRPYLRIGSVQAIPFSREDAFDLLVAVDVLEHVAMGAMSKVVAGIHALGVAHLALVINHTGLLSLGHVTLKPLPWWDGVMAPFFRRDPSVMFDQEGIPPLYSLDGGADSQFTFWRREGVRGG